MTKKIIILGVAIIMCLGILTGCNSGIKFSIGYESKGYANGAFSFTDANGEELGAHNAVRLVTSVAELKAFCSESNNPAFSEDSPKFSNNLSKKIRELDEAFFAEKALIVVLLTAANAGIVYTVKSVDVDEDTLFVSIKRKESKGNSAQVITPWTFLIEVNQVDIVDIANVKIK